MDANESKTSEVSGFVLTGVIHRFSQIFAVEFGAPVGHLARLIKSVKICAHL
jgi:hypothetical protein